MNRKCLPEELIFEILLKLPIKSLLRFRCVCKSWYNLIKNPNFINTHLLKNRNSNYIILIRTLLDSSTVLGFHDYESLDVISPDLELPLVFRMEPLEFSGPCNGLICLSNCLNCIVICNPSTRQFRVLPRASYTCPEGYPNVKSIGLGLGFDSSTNDYKLVSFICFSAKQNRGRYHRVAKEIICLIYNLSTNCWREVDHKRDLDMRFIEPDSPGVLLNGVVHWIAYGEDASGDEELFIFRFDMSTELFGYLNYPLVGPDEDKSRRLVVFDDSLALFSYTNPWVGLEQQFVDMWVMKQYGVKESWTKQFTIGPVTRIHTPLFVWKNEAVLMEGTKGLEDIGTKLDPEEDVEGELVSCGFDNAEVHAYQKDGFRNIIEVLVNHESLISI